MCGTLCAPSTSTTAPAAWACAVIFFTGFTVPRLLLMCVNATSFGSCVSNSA
jgi:hypothetical protein